MREVIQHEATNLTAHHLVLVQFDDSFREIEQTGLKCNASGHRISELLFFLLQDEDSSLSSDTNTVVPSKGQQLVVLTAELTVKLSTDPKAIFKGT